MQKNEEYAENAENYRKLLIIVEILKITYKNKFKINDRIVLIII